MVEDCFCCRKTFRLGQLLDPCENIMYLRRMDLNTQTIRQVRKFVLASLNSQRGGLVMAGVQLEQTAIVVGMSQFSEEQASRILDVVKVSILNIADQKLAPKLNLDVIKLESRQQLVLARVIVEPGLPHKLYSYSQKLILHDGYNSIVHQILTSFVLRQSRVIRLEGLQLRKQATNRRVLPQRKNQFQHIFNQKVIILEGDASCLRELFKYIDLTKVLTKNIPHFLKKQGVSHRFELRFTSNQSCKQTILLLKQNQANLKHQNVLLSFFNQQRRVIAAQQRVSKQKHQRRTQQANISYIDKKQRNKRPKKSREEREEREQYEQRYLKSRKYAQTGKNDKKSGNYGEYEYQENIDDKKQKHYERDQYQYKYGKQDEQEKKRRREKPRRLQDSDSSEEWDSRFGKGGKYRKYYYSDRQRNRTYCQKNK